MGDEIEKFVDVPGGYLYCRIHGRGRDVVLLNAGAADLRMWETTLRWLPQIARVTTFDYRDTGLSSRGTEPYSEVEDIAAVMDAAGAGTAVLVGVSDGVRRALAFAHRYPDRVSRVVAVGGTFGEFPDPSPEESAARVRLRELFARLERVLDPPVKTRFAEIATPISVLVGGHDFEGTRLWAERLVKQAPDADLTVLPEADHFPMLSAPQQFETFLRETLQQT